MKKNNAKKKFISAVAVLALSATAVCGALSFSACGDKYISDGSTAPVKVGNHTAISTARGTVKTTESGTVYYVSPQSSDNPVANDINNPYDISQLLRGTGSPLKPGDIVYVLPGVYETSARIEMYVSGAYNSYIQILNAAYFPESGYTGTETAAVFDFSQQAFESTARGVQIYGNYIYWYGVDICGAGDNGLYIGGSYNTIEYSEFYNNRDTGLQLGRSFSEYDSITQWPSYNLIKNCTSHNNYDNETYGENADGFAAKLTVGYGNVFDGCIAYRNSDDGWDLYAKTESGNIGTVIIYNCVAFENGYLEYTQQECNRLYPTWNNAASEAGVKDENGNPYTKDDPEYYGKNCYTTRDGDGNGFKLGGSVMEGDVIMYNCLSFNNRMHGVTDNSNPGVLSLTGITSYNNSGALSDTYYVQKLLTNAAGKPVDKDGNVVSSSEDYVYVDTDVINTNFGYISDVSNSDSHGNIDVSRQTYSYNNLNRILSVGDSYAKSLSNDAYRGAVTDSVLYAGSNSNFIVGSIDADTKNGGQTYTTQKTRVSSTDLFKELPFVKNSDGSYTHNISGLSDLYTDISIGALNPNRIHFAYRNSDGSVNMGNILAKKDGIDNTYLINGKDLGSTLNLESWDDYTHYYESGDLINGDAETEARAIVERTAEALNLNCDPANVYQDFDVPSKMIGVTLSWKSENEDVLKVGTDKDVSISDSEYIMIYVYRPLTDPVTVKLTATLSYGGVSLDRDFEVTVMPGQPSIGTIFVTAEDGTVITDGGSLVIDRYSIFSEPVVSVENGLDYNGKLLTKDQYTVNSTYYYQKDTTTNSIQVSGYSPSTAGVYTITHKITLANDTNATKSMSYKIYTASMTANVQFIGSTSLALNRDGYTISGSLSSATGYLYAISSATALNNLTAEQLVGYEGVEAKSFRSESINLDFTNANNDGYHIYYVLTNMNREVTSSVYHSEIQVVDIDTPAKFMTMAGGKAVGAETPVNTIYRLTKDLDFTGVTYTVGSAAFTGVLNGLGHSVKNITLNATKANTGVFYKVSGGTIENIKFENINIKVNANVNKVGLVSECTYGTFYNIQMTNVAAYSQGQRVAALIGQASSNTTGTPIVIEQVSLINNDDYTIEGAQRTGGLIGFSQTSDNDTYIYVYITNCYVDAHIVAAYELGGLYGTYDCGNNASSHYYLEITSCIFAGTVTATGSKSYAGGILGYQKGNNASMIITDCISIGSIEFAGVALTSGLKNASGIVGCFQTVFLDTTVSRVVSCLALIEEYNTDFDVTVPTDISMSSQFANRLSEKNWTIHYREGNATLVEAPYATLKFLGNWSDDEEEEEVGDNVDSEAEAEAE